MSSKIDNMYIITVLTKQADLNTELRTTLIEEYANKSRSSDREIYIKIRNYYTLQQFDLETQ